MFKLTLTYNNLKTQIIISKVQIFRKVFGINTTFKLFTDSALTAQTGKLFQMSIVRQPKENDL